MPLYQPLVPTRYARLLLSYLLRSDEHRLQDVLRGSGMELSRITLSDAALSFAEFDALICALHRHTGRTDIGFELGLGMSADTHGVLGEAMKNSRTAGDVLALAARFNRLMSSGFTLKYRPHELGFELVWQPATGMSSFTLHAFYEIHVVSLYRVLDELLGDRLTPFESWLPMAEPAHHARYGSLPRLRAHFVSADLPEVRTLIPHALASAPLHPGHAMATPALGELQRMQNAFVEADDWRAWVELMLQESENCQPTQAELAEMLNVSVHTLSRRLEKEGTGFRQLSLRIRNHKACALLRHTTLSIEQIACRLGYDHAANLTHAFRRANGMSPRDYRRQLTEQMTVQQCMSV